MQAGAEGNPRRSRGLTDKENPRSNPGLNIWEVGSCKFSMIFTSGAVVGVGSVGLVSEVAEVVGFVFGGYLGGPFFESFVPVDAFVF